MRVANTEEYLALGDFMTQFGEEVRFPTDKSSNFLALVAVKGTDEDPRYKVGEPIYGALTLGVTATGVAVECAAVDPVYGEEALITLGEKVLLLDELCHGTVHGPDDEIALFNELSGKAGVDYFSEAR